MPGGAGGVGGVPIKTELRLSAGPVLCSERAFLCGGFSGGSSCFGFLLGVADLGSVADSSVFTLSGSGGGGGDFGGSAKGGGGGFAPETKLGGKTGAAFLKGPLLDEEAGAACSVLT